MFQSWFTSKCMAYVDDAGHALAGPELEAARKDPRAKRCGNIVRTRAKFCGRCGAPAPTAWCRCGGCGKWIGQESQHCPHCGHEQNMAARVSLDNGVWRKGDDVFAQRFELNDIAFLLNRGLIIQEGQCAILLRNGLISDVLPPGHYPAKDLVDMEEYLKSGDRKSVILLEMSDVVFPVMASGLLSKDDIPLDLTCAVVLRFEPKQADDFLTNVMKNHAYAMEGELNAVLSYGELARNILIAEIEIASRDFCNVHTSEELFKDPKLRIELEDYVGLHLKRTLDASGLAFCRLAEVEFQSPLFDTLRQMSGDVEVKRKEIEFQLRAEALADDATKREALGKMEIEDYMNQLAQEKGIRDNMREQEMIRLKAVVDQERAIADLECKYQQARKEFTDTSELEKLQTAHDEELKKVTHNGELERRRREHALLLEQRLSEQNNAFESEKIEVAIQELRSKAALALAEAKEKLRLQNLTNELGIRKGIPLEEQIAVETDPVKRHHLMKLYKMQQENGMSEVQLLARSAADGSKEAAAALAAMNKEKVEVIEEARKTERELMERTHQTLVDVIGKVTGGLSGNNSGNTDSKNGK